MMILLLILVYLIDALSYSATQIALAYANPVMCMTLRMFLGGALLTTLVRFRYPEQWWMVRTTWYQHRWLWCKIIVIYLYVTYIGFFIGMHWMSSAYVALLYNLTPLIIALFGYFLADQQMNRTKWGALILGFISIIPITVGNHATALYPGYAEISMLFSVCAMAYGWFIVHALMQIGHSPLIINGVGMLGASVLALVTSLLFEGSLHERWPGLQALFDTHQGTQIPGIVFFVTALLCSVVAVELIFYNATAFFMRYYSLVFVSFVGMLTPIMVALLNWKFFQEPLPPLFIPSFILLAISLICFYQQELITVFQHKKQK